MSNVQTASRRPHGTWLALLVHDRICKGWCPGVELYVYSESDR